MVGIVLVSHSHALAEAALRLCKSMTGEEVSIAVAAGIGDHFKELGTDAMAIYEAIESVASPEGVLVLMDMGSAVLSTEMALDFLDEDLKSRVKLCAAPFVEGAVAASVAAKIGRNLDEVYKEAMGALTQKQNHLGEEASPDAPKKVTLEGGSVLRVVIPNPQGLHARPAANLVQLAGRFDSDIQITNLSNGRGPVSIKSMNSLIGLEALQGDQMEIRAKGADEADALAVLKKEIEKGLGDSLSSVESKKPGKEENKEPIGLGGGIVIQSLYRREVTAPVVSKNNSNDPEKEIRILQMAIQKSIADLQAKAENLKLSLGENQTQIFQAQATMLSDPELETEAIKIIRDESVEAVWAWKETAQHFIQQYESLQDAGLRQRANDLRDATNLVLKNLGVEFTENLNPSEPAILLVEDLSPAEVTALDKAVVKGVICLEGGPTSHSAILLRTRGIPAIVLAKYAKENLTTLKNGQLLTMNGARGQILVEPRAEVLADWKAQQAKQEEKEEILTKLTQLPAISLDGFHIPVLANVGRKEDVDLALYRGAEGIGLLRTEFMFLDRDQAPDEEEQVSLLQAMLQPFRKKPVVIRTLDAGGDKNLPYLQMPEEENPFLGVRAIRLCLRNPELFQTQLRALLRVSAEADVHLMFPMIAKPEELQEAKAALNQAHESLETQGIKHRWPIPTGMMIEIPSAALRAEEFAAQVDFFSIGTNDLIQYTMAADRTNADLQQSLAKGLPPAVRTLIKMTAEAAHRYGIPVAVCGETASHPELAEILLGLGIDELSMNPTSIPEIKDWIRHQSIKELEQKYR